MDAILERVGRQVVVGAPLGLGKANVLLNELYRRACADGSLELTIITALTLEVPRPRGDLETRFLGPVYDRVFDGVVELDYAAARRRDALPANVTVHEFFMTPGRWLNQPDAQRDYISSNYTHVARDMLERGVNVIAQMVSPGVGRYAGRYSLACNSDVTVDLVPALRAANPQAMVIGEINDQLPFMCGDADVAPAYFDALCRVDNGGYRLFGPPKTPVSLADHAIGLHASTLIRDGGTLQVGIGSMGDAIVNALLVRQRDNRRYRAFLDGRTHPTLVAAVGGLGPFELGLYGATEMLVDGFLDLYEAGILSRRVYDNAVLQSLINQGRVGPMIELSTVDSLVAAGGVAPVLTTQTLCELQRFGILRDDLSLAGNRLCWPDGTEVPADLGNAETRERLRACGLGERLTGGVVAHGGFFLGPESFYERLRCLDDATRALFPMTGVGRINQLYGGEELDRAQRHEARFVNSCLMVTLNGAVVSDGLADGRVLSGVGGQYNFVAMAHALPTGRSIIMARATRTSGTDVTSNIVFGYGHATVPRHLRDIVVTEYGVADLRGKTDAECAVALIGIADARFQSELLAQARRAHKLPPGFVPPARWQNNTPQTLRDWLGSDDARTVFPPFPLGSSLTADEQAIGAALKGLKARTASTPGRLRTVLRALMDGPPDARTQALLARLGLDAPNGWREKLTARLVSYALRSNSRD